MGGVLDLLVRGRDARRLRQPVGAVLGGWIIGVAETLAGEYIGLHRLRPEDPRAAGDHLRRAAGPAATACSARRRWRGHEQRPPDPAGRVGSRRCCRRWPSLLPFFFGAVPRRRSSRWCCIYAVAVLGLNLLVGYSGQISLGHGAFFALGAYTRAILIDRPRRAVPADLPGRRRRLLRSPASRSDCPRCACAGSTSRWSRSAVAIATPQLIKRFDGLTGGTPGPHRRPAHRARLVGPRRRPVAVLRHARRGRGDVRARRVPRARRGSAARWSRSATTRSRRARWASTSRATRRARSRSARPTRASAARSSRSPIGFVAPESFPLALSFAFLAAIVVGGLATVGGRGVRRAVHRVRAGLRGRRRRGAGGRDLRRRADRSSCTCFRAA